MFWALNSYTGGNAMKPDLERPVSKRISDVPPSQINPSHTAGPHMSTMRAEAPIFWPPDAKS